MRDRSALVEPFWRSTTMRAESLLFVRPSSDAPAEATLLFTPMRVPRLESASGTVAYEPGRDYAWAPGSRRIRLTTNSRIPFSTDADLYPPRGSQKHGTCRDREADLLFAEGAELHRVQMAATYEHRHDGWAARWTPTRDPRLGRLGAALHGGEPLRIVLLGDSISVGANASGLYDEPPGNPGYGPLVAGALRERYRSPITFTNLSVGGMGAEWGISQMGQVIAERPDLLLIAFGMNDASARKPEERFGDDIAQQLEVLSRQCPGAEALLVAGMTGNPRWTGTHEEFYPRYRDRLAAMRREGVGLADVFTVWRALVERKNYLDLSGNGLNHPNDFGHRVYAMVVLAALEGALSP